MANEMGSKDLDLKTDESEEASYRIVLYRPQFPKEIVPKILANFLNSLKYGNDYFKLIDKDAYFPIYSMYVQRLLDKEAVGVRIAELKDGTILGWCLFEGPILHYVFVNKDVRGNGIAKALLPKQIDCFTHLTNKGINLWLKHYPESRFNPFA